MSILIKVYNLIKNEHLITFLGREVTGRNLFLKALLKVFYICPQLLFFQHPEKKLKRKILINDVDDVKHT